MRHSGREAARRRQAGLSVVELMVVLAVLGIIAVLAMTSYSDFTTRSRRAEAMEALQAMANQQQVFYADNNTYSGTRSDIGPAESKNGYYQLQITAADATSYEMRAEAAADGPQADDGDFRLLSDGTREWDPDSDGTFECTWEDARRGSGC